jgi:hypothetical protein
MLRNIVLALNQADSSSGEDDSEEEQVDTDAFENDALRRLRPTMRRELDHDNEDD